MAIIAKNIIVGDKPLDKEEPKVVEPVVAKNIIVGGKPLNEKPKPTIKIKESIPDIIPLEQVSMVPKELEKKYKKEKEHGILLNHDDIKHSAYHLDMILQDI